MSSYAPFGVTFSSFIWNCCGLCLRGAGGLDRCNEEVLVLLLRVSVVSFSWKSRKPAFEIGLSC